MTPDNTQMILVAVQPPASLVGTAIDMATGQPRQLFAQSAAGVRALAASPDRSALFILTNAQIERVDVATGQSTPVPLSIEAPVDCNAEMQYIFDHQWRLVQSKFYDADMHGVDWPAMRDAYAKYLPHISHWEDFAELLSELQGELDASHMYVHFASDNPAWDQTAELGIYYDTSHEGPGVQVREVLPGGPADLVGPPLQAGAVISAVDGVEISADQDIYPLLDRNAGRVLRLTVQPPDGGPPADQLVRAAAPGAEYELAYERWVEKRRAMVDELSGGRLGYTHVRGMDDASFRQVYADLMGPARDREGAIIDTRFNLGGLLHDQLTAFLTGERHSGLVTRTGVDLGTSPFTRWAKPTALLMNSWNYSDASVFPYYYIREEIGPSVGDRVPGTGTAVLSLPQQEPRLTIAFAQLGFRTMEGDFFENREIVPDEIVRADPDALEEGRDPQLEAAVAALIRAIDD
jgi:tricorn protease